MADVARLFALPPARQGVGRLRCRARPPHARSARRLHQQFHLLLGLLGAGRNLGAATIALNNFDNIEVRTEAVFDQETTVTIRQPHDANTGANSILPSTSPDVPSWQVPAVTLDKVLPAGLPIRLLKVDVEGADLHALRGGAERLRGPDAPLVMCEVADDMLRKMGASSAELMALMTDLGYQAYFCTRFSLTPASAEEVAKQDTPLHSPNLVFSKVSLGRSGLPSGR
jgi:FkbM family methyltransferase